MLLLCVKKLLMYHLIQYDMIILVPGRTMADPVLCGLSSYSTA